MMDTSLPAGGDQPPLHLHSSTEHEWHHWWQESMFDDSQEHRSCVCGLHEVRLWVENDDGHAGGFPHPCWHLAKST